MVTFAEMGNVSVLVEVLARVVAILGIGQIVFRSKGRDYVAGLLQRRMQAARSQLSALGESTKKRVVDPVTQSEKIVVNPEVLAVVRPQMKRLRRKMMVWDGVMYLLSCVFCQSAWIVMGIYCVLESFGWFDFMMTVAVYATLCMWVHGKMMGGVVPRESKSGGCGR